MRTWWEVADVVRGDVVRAREWRSETKPTRAYGTASRRQRRVFSRCHARARDEEALGSDEGSMNVLLFFLEIDFQKLVRANSHHAGAFRRHLFATAKRGTRLHGVYAVVHSRSSFPSHESPSRASIVYRTAASRRDESSRVTRFVARRLARDRRLRDRHPSPSRKPAARAPRRRPAARARCA